MGRPRKPTKVLELRGSFDKNPSRRRVDPVPTGPLGDPPSVLDESCQARWEEIAHAAPWLTNAHRPLVEETCRIWTRLRSGTEKMSDSKSLTVNLSKLGMTPTDVSKVLQVPVTPKSKASQYAS